jgi:hypothetical protein
LSDVLQSEPLNTVQDLMACAMRKLRLSVDVFTMDHATIERHPGASKISDKHSSVPIVVGIRKRVAILCSAATIIHSI